MPRIVDSSHQMIQEAAERLRAGEVLAFPTETVYGLAADLFSVTAIEEIYRLKGRPSENPLIAHVTNAAMAQGIARSWDERCDALARRFWPGPLTVVLQRSSEVPEQATAGRATIAVRAPRHEVAQQLLRSFGGPIAAPSANRSGHVSPTTAAHVAADFQDSADLLILQGGECQIGLESTVLDLTSPTPRILRPGSISVIELRDVVGEVTAPIISEQAASPGTSQKHYAPSTPAELVASADLPGRLMELDEPAAVICFSPPARIGPHRAIVMPEGAGEYGRRLYGALREADASGCSRIIIEMPPQTNELWKTIGDRLRRATR